MGCVSFMWLDKCGMICRKIIKIESRYFKKENCSAYDSNLIKAEVV